MGRRSALPGASCVACVAPWVPAVGVDGSAPGEAGRWLEGRAEAGAETGAATKVREGGVEVGTEAGERSGGARAAAAGGSSSMSARSTGSSSDSGKVGTLLSAANVALELSVASAAASCKSTRCSSCSVNWQTILSVAAILSGEYRDAAACGEEGADSRGTKRAEVGAGVDVSAAAADSGSGGAGAADMGGVPGGVTSCWVRCWAGTSSSWARRRAARAGDKWSRPREKLSLAMMALVESLGPVVASVTSSWRVDWGLRVDWRSSEAVTSAATASAGAASAARAGLPTSSSASSGAEYGPFSDESQGSSSRHGCLGEPRPSFANKRSRPLTGGVGAIGVFMALNAVGVAGAADAGVAGAAGSEAAAAAVGRSSSKSCSTRGVGKAARSLRALSRASARSASRSVT